MFPGEVIVISMAGFSCICSLYVLISGLVFPDLMDKKFMRIIFFMSIADFCTNVCGTLGYPPSGSVVCWVQGIFILYFTVASWLWTLVLYYNVYRVVKFAEFCTHTWGEHILCWGLPAILALLPISQTNYGRDEADPQWCVIGSGTSSSVVWAYACYFVWLFLITIALILMLVLVHLRFRNSVSFPLVKQVYEKVWLYPIAMLGLNFLSYICLIIFRQNAGTFITVLSMVSLSSYGIFTAVIYFVKSPETRSRWKHYLHSGERFSSMIGVISVDADFLGDDEFVRLLRQTIIDHTDHTIRQTEMTGGLPSSFERNTIDEGQDDTQDDDYYDQGRETDNPIAMGGDHQEA